MDGRAVRQRCGACGWSWISSVPGCPRCREQGGERAKPGIRTGWHPSAVAPHQIEFYGPAGAFLGSVQHRRGTWGAFTTDRLLGESTDLAAAMKLVEQASST